jgi:hypothetical protein
MRQNELETNLQPLSKTDLYIVLWYVRLRWLRYKISLLRPQQIIIPATLLQIVVLILAALHPHNFIFIVSIGSFIVVALALLPMTLPRPLKAHWIRQT